MNIWVVRNKGGEECDGCLSRVRGRLVFKRDDNFTCCRRCLEDVVWDAGEDDDYLNDIEDES